MRTLFVVITFLLSLSSSYALMLETKWSESSQKSLSITCNEDSACEQFCDGKSCEISEKICKNCVSTSISMTFAFKEMGRSIISKEKLDAYALFDLLENGDFVSLTSRSLYNLVERFNSNELKRRFRSLCGDGTDYPHAFFDKTESGEIGTAQLVWCNTGVYRLERLTELPEGPELY